MNGYVLYDGPSKLDGQSIVAISTGFDSPSRNPKTGEMIQTWILRRDMTPSEALRTGADASICGDCQHRPHIDDDGHRRRTCYVSAFQAPRQVYGALLRGNYQMLGSLADITKVHEGKSVRLGAYGDPAALPLSIVTTITKQAKSWTGYTHQWKTCDRRFRTMLMASVDSLTEYAEATAKGWRTFRVRALSEALHGLEITCPASDEAGKRTSCIRCTLCNGAHSFRRGTAQMADQRKNIAIQAHGVGTTYFSLKALKATL